MKTGFIGAGNMASAIMEGLCSSACLAPQELAVFDVDAKKAVALGDRYGIRVCPDVQTLANSADCIVLAVKPNVIATVLSEISGILREKQPLLLTIAAGKSLSFYADTLGFPVRMVRVMPNINASVLAAVSAYCGSDTATGDDLQFAEKFCASFGTAIALPEKMFPIFGVIGGSAPAYAYLFIDALARAAVQQGMPRAQAQQVAAQMVLGSAKMVLKSDAHPQELIDRVCSPGGTTIEGLLSLQKDGFEAAVANAVRAAADKDKRL